MKKLKTNEKRAIQYYCDHLNKKTYLNWCESYKQAGYSLCHGWKTNACRVHNKGYIKAAIDAKMAIITKNEDITREYCTQKLQDIVENSVRERNKLTAISLLGDFSGFKRENAPNSEREAARLSRMDDEERAFRKFYARERCKDISRGKTVPIKAEGA